MHRFKPGLVTTSPSNANGVFFVISYVRMSESGPKLHERIPEFAGTHLKELQDLGRQEDLEYTGFGGEHVVFKVKQKEGRDGEYRGIVAKAQMHFIRSAVERWALEQWKIAPGEYSDDANLRVAVEDINTVAEERIVMEEQIQREKEFFEKLKKFFPKEKVLQARAKIMNVPVASSVVRSIMDENFPGLVNPEGPIDVVTIVRYQRIIPNEAEMDKEDTVSFGTRYAERFNIPFDQYDQFNRAALFGEGGVDRTLLGKFLHGKLADTLLLAKKDAELHATLSDLVSRLIDFTNKTGQMVDFAGGGNIRVFKNEKGKWDYLLADVYAGGEWSDVVKVSKQLVDRTYNYDRAESGHLLHAVNYARAVNSIAEVLDVDTRVSLFNSEDLQGSTMAFSEDILRNLRSRLGWPDRIAFEEREYMLTAPMNREYPSGDVTVPMKHGRPEETS